MKRIAVFLLAILAAAPLYAGTRDLKQSTAGTYVVGPFIGTDGSAVTAPTIASIDITAYKNDGTAVTITPAASGSSNDMVHIDDGYYSLELTTTDTGTAGYLRLSFQISGSLIFHEDFNVLPANIFDSKYGSDKLEVDVSQFGGAAGTFASGIPAVDLTAAERRKLTTYTTVTYISTSDNAKTVIEAASAGTLCILGPGTHSTTTINVPTGVAIRGAGWQNTLVTGNPGSGSLGNFVFEGAALLEDVKVVAATQGHCVQLKNSSTQSDVVIRNCWLTGDDDCVVIYEATGGRQRFLMEGGVMDQTVWDGLLVQSAHADVTFRGVRFIGTFNGIYINVDAHRVSVDVSNCKFDYSVTTGTQCPIRVVVSGSSAARVFVTLANTSFNLLSSSQKHIQTDSGTGTGIVWVDDNGGCNIGDSFVTLTGSGSRFQRTYPVATNVIVAASALATNAATAATQATAAASSASTAATQATTAATQTTASAQRAALGFASANADTQLSAIASSASTASTQSTNAASQTTASAQRAALGFASANADTQLSGIASNASTAATQSTTAATQIGTAGAGLTNIDLPNQTMNITGSITGSLSGSVGSVTGAVGSVTGNVGGSVASVSGSVGSVTGNVGGNVTGSVGSLSGVTFPSGFSTLTTANIQSGLAVPGSPMTLADDAITAAKFDESTAFPVKSADASSTALARTGADGDTLKSLSDEVSLISTGSNPNVILESEIASVTNQTTIVLNDGATFNDAYNGQTVVLYDNSNSDYPSVRIVSDYVGSTKTVTLDSAPDFTVAADDSVRLFATAPGTAAPTAATIAAAVRADQAVELGRMDVAVSSRNATTPPTAAAVASQVRTELTTELGRIDAATSTRAATGAAMTLTSGERNTIAAAVLDEALSGHTTAGTLGKAMGDTAGTVATNLDAKVSESGGAVDLTPVLEAIDALPTATEVVTQLFATNTADSGSGKVGRAFHYLVNSYASLGKFSENALENAPAGEGGGGGVLTDVDQEPVPTSRTFTLLPDEDDGLSAEKPKTIRISADPNTYAVDFINDLPVNGRIITVSEPTIVDGDESGLTFGAVGRDKSLAKFRVEGNTAGTYTVRVDVVYDSGAASSGTVQFNVAE